MAEFLVGQQRRIEWCVHRERIFPDSPERRFARYPSRYSESRQPAPAVRSALLSAAGDGTMISPNGRLQERRHRSHPGARAPDVAADPAAPTPAWQVADRPSRPRSVTPETTRSRHAIHEVRPQRFAGVAALPWHDDVRASVRRGESRAILDAAAEGGIDFLDTADVYPLGGDQGTVGRTEEILGGWLAGKRQNFVLATKCVGRMGPKPWNQGMSRKHILDAVEASLRRLRTDYVDLYQLHSYEPETPIDEALEALDRVVRSGKARYVGVSNWPAHSSPGRSGGRAEGPGPHHFRSAPLQPAVQGLRERPAAVLREEGIAVIPYNPLAGGFLSGKHAKANLRGGHTLRLGQRGSDVPGALLA